PTQSIPHPLTSLSSRIQHVDSQSVLSHPFAFLRNTASQLADKPRHSGRFPCFGPDPEKVAKPVDIHVAWNDIRLIVLAHDFRLLVLVANLANDFFYQIFNCDQARDSAVLVDDNGHPDIVLLHLAQQIAAELALRHEIHVFTHQSVNSACLSFRIGDLQDILRKNYSHDVMDRAFEYGNTRKRLGAQQFDELL